MQLDQQSLWTTEYDATLSANFGGLLFVGLWIFIVGGMASAVVLLLAAAALDCAQGRLR